MTQLIAVANLKGGVAKTTTTASLAGALVERGLKVLAVDLDAQANLTSALGGVTTQSTAVDVFFDWQPLHAVAQPTRVKNLHLVASHPDLALAERFLPVRTNFEKILRQSARQAQDYDYIVMDCPPFLGSVTLNALNAANLLIIPTIPEIFSWESLRKTIHYAGKVRASYNPGLVYRVLVVMLDARLRIHREITEQYHFRFGDLLYASQIQVDTRLRESAVTGLPVNVYAPQTRSADQYRSLAKEICENERQGLFSPVREQDIELSG
jgi:chromosome partitioning protein